MSEIKVRSCGSMAEVLVNGIRVDDKCTKIVFMQKAGQPGTLHLIMRCHTVEILGNDVSVVTRQTGVTSPPAGGAK